MTIGENIKNLRLQHGLSQAELAKVAGVSDKAVSSWEQNKATPRMGAIQKMADFFGVQKSVIIESNATSSDMSSAARPVLNRIVLNLDETNLVANYRSLNGNNRQVVNALITLLISQQLGDAEFEASVQHVKNSNSLAANINAKIINGNLHNNGGTNIVNVGKGNFNTPASSQ